MNNSFLVKKNIVAAYSPICIIPAPLKFKYIHMYIYIALGQNIIHIYSIGPYMLYKDIYIIQKILHIVTNEENCHLFCAFQQLMNFLPYPTLALMVNMAIIVEIISTINPTIVFDGLYIGVVFFYQSFLVIHISDIIFIYQAFYLFGKSILGCFSLQRFPRRSFCSLKTNQLNSVF